MEAFGEGRIPYSIVGIRGTAEEQVLGQGRSFVERLL
jgi:hypothetical protein